MGGLCSSEAVEDMQKLGQLARGGAYLLSLVGVRSQRSGRANRGGLCAGWDVEFIEAILCKVGKLFGLGLLLGAVALREQWNYDGDCRSTGLGRQPVGDSVAELPTV